MSDLDDDIDLTDEQMFLELSDKVDKLEENLRIGLGCDKPDAPEVCNKMKGGKRKRKSRKKRRKRKSRRKTKKRRRSRRRKSRRRRR